MSNAAAIAAGGYHSLALKQDGTVVAWGDNSDGQTNVPSGLSNVIAVAAGGYHSLALKQDGTVAAWGNNGSGQTNVPSGLSNVIAIAAGYFHSLALDQDGTVVAWGDNSYGQASVPADLSGGGVVAIAAGASHTLALEQDGTVVAWGDNTYGQTGVPSGFGGVIAIAAGGSHSLALKQDGTVVAWGDNSHGQATVPAGLSNVIAIAGGQQHSLALVYPGPVPPAIAVPPQTRTVGAGSTLDLGVVADGAPPLSYQWFFDATNALTGATNAVLELTSVQPLQGGAYNVVVTNLLGAVTSPAAVLTVVAPPSLITIPTNLTADLGATVDFIVAAIGWAPLSYQWFFNRTNALTGATNPVLELTNVQPLQCGAYNVVVTNLGGAVTSSAAMLTVRGAAPVILTPPSNQTVTAGTTVQTAARFCVDAVGALPLTYQWFVNGTNAIPGATNNLLELVNPQPNAAGTYTVAVTDAFGAVTCSTATLTVLSAVTVSACSEDLLRAATTAGGGAVLACDGTITLSRTITNSVDMILDGSGHQVTISGGGAVRPFCVGSNVTLTLVNLAVANGFASDGQAGAILNVGGTLNATNCTFSGNLATNASGGQAQGGAIFSTNGQVALNHCVFTGNTARGFDATWSFAYEGPGGGALGGAVCSLGFMDVANSTFASNSVTGGAGGLGAVHMPPAWPGGGFSGGLAEGGALFNGGTGTVSGSTFAWNLAAGGAGGAGGSTPISSSPLPGGPGGDGGAGDGSALFGGGVTALINCTFASNGGVGGAGGAGGEGQTPWAPEDLPGSPGGDGGSGGPGGGAIAGNCTVTNCTLAFNSVAGGGAGPGGGGSASGRPGSPGTSGGPVSAAWLLNTLLAGNTPTNGLTGAVIDTNRNLWADSAAGILGPLADNGGPTLTMALLPGSPAIGAADSAAAPPTDQRGFPRPPDSADIGAYEFGYPPILAAAQAPGGGADISVSGRAGQVCRLLVSPDLLNWTAVTTNAFSPSGVFLFHDPAGAGQTQRFYRAVMP